MREGKKWLVYFPSENQKPDLDLPTILEMSAKSKKSKGTAKTKAKIEIWNTLPGLCAKYAQLKDVY